MKKVRIIAIVSIVCVVIAYVGSSIKEEKAVKSLSEKNSSSIWKEIPITEGTSFAKCNGIKEFDLKKIVTEADYVFRGIIIDRKEYKVEWIDDKGEKWGPFPSSVLEVKVTYEYNGESPVDGNIIKVYYPYSLSTVFEGSFLIKDDEEYVFLTQIFDDEFMARRKQAAPEDNFQQEKYADVYISNPSYSIMAIEKGTVFMYNDYFSWDGDTMKQIKKGTSVKTNKMSSSDLIEKGWFIALDENKFDIAFSNLFKNPKKLPDAKDLQKIKKNN